MITKISPAGTGTEERGVAGGEKGRLEPLKGANAREIAAVISRRVKSPLARVYARNTSRRLPAVSPSSPRHHPVVTPSSPRRHHPTSLPPIPRPIITNQSTRRRLRSAFPLNFPGQSVTSIAFHIPLCFTGRVTMDFSTLRK
jgi:hypothetical protein